MGAGRGEPVVFLPVKKQFRISKLQPESAKNRNAAQVAGRMKLVFGQNQNVKQIIDTYLTMRVTQPTYVL
jgi:hypothetical protein